MSALDDLKATVEAAIAKFGDTNAAKAALDLEQKAHVATRDALNAAKTDAAAVESELAALKTKIASVLGLG